MSLIQSIVGALGQKYDESKPVIDSELLEYATPKQAESLAKWDALSKEGNKMAGAFALALRIKLAKVMDEARVAADEARDGEGLGEVEPRKAKTKKKVVRAKAAK